MLVFDTLSDLIAFLLNSEISGAEVDSKEQSITAIMDNDIIDLARKDYDAEIVRPIRRKRKLDINCFLPLTLLVITEFPAKFLIEC